MATATEMDPKPVESDDRDRVVLTPMATPYDPYLYMVGAGPGVQKNATLDFNAVRAMFEQCAVLGAIRNTRLSQISAFTQRWRPESEG